MRAKLTKIYGNIAIVLVVVDYDVPVAYAIDITHVKGMRVGEEFDVSQDVIDAGTEYSVDWDIVIPDGFHIPVSEIHESLINRGIYTFEDYRNNPRLVHDALNVMIGKLRVHLSEKVKEIGG